MKNILLPREKLATIREKLVIRLRILRDEKIFLKNKVANTETDLDETICAIRDIDALLRSSVFKEK